MLVALRIYARVADQQIMDYFSSKTPDGLGGRDIERHNNRD